MADVFSFPCNSALRATPARPPDTGDTAGRSGGGVARTRIHIPQALGEGEEGAGGDTETAQTTAGRHRWQGGCGPAEGDTRSARGRKRRQRSGGAPANTTRAARGRPEGQGGRRGRKRRKRSGGAPAHLMHQIVLAGPRHCNALAVGVRRPL